MIDITNHSGNANQNHMLSPQTWHSGYYKVDKQQALEIVG